MARKDEISSELPEARPPQATSEEEFDEVSERWSEERRQLHSEIDSLYRVQEEARKTSRQTNADDGENVARLQSKLDEASANRQKAEEELTARTRKWETKEGKLKESVARLEASLVEEIERANNAALRVGTAQDAKLAEYKSHIQKLKAQAGQRAEEATREWDAERAQVDLELERLRKATETRPKALPPNPLSIMPPPPPPSVAPSKRKKPSFTDRVRARFDSGASTGSSISSATGAPETDVDSQRSKLASFDQERTELVRRAGELEQALGEARKQTELVSGERDSILQERDTLRDRAARIEEDVQTREEWERERSRLEARVVEVERNALQQKGRTKNQQGQGNEAVAELKGQLAGAQQQIEEVRAQLSTATTDWASEREDLNATIARLEEDGGDTASVEDRVEMKFASRLSTLESARSELQTLFQSGRDAWDSERESLAATISELEAKLEEAHRRLPSDHTSEEFKSEADAVAAARAKAEEKLSLATAKWDAERNTLKSTIEELRRAEGKNTSNTGQLAAVAGEWTADRQKLESAIETLTQSVRDTTSKLDHSEKARRGLEKNLQVISAELKSEQKRESAPSVEEQEAVIKEREEAVRNDVLDRLGVEIEVQKAEHERQRSAEIRELRAALEQEYTGALAAAKSESESRANDLEAQTAAWSTERAQLQTQIADAHSLLDEAADSMKALEQTHNTALAAAKSESESRASDLETQTAAWSAERTQLQAQVADAHNLLDEAADNMKALEQAHNTALTAAKSESESRASDLEAQTAAWSTERTQLQAQVADAHNLLDEAADNMKALEQAHDTALTAAKSESESRASDLEAQTARWSAERKQLQAEIADAHNLRDEVAHKAKALEHDHNSTLAAAKSESDSRASDLEAQTAKWSVERKQLRAEIADAHSLRDEAVDKLKALQREKKKAGKGQNSGKSKPVDTAQRAHITGEVERVSSALDMLALKIDNPSTDLSAGMRASREQTELMNYLKGLRFALGEEQE